MADYPQDEIEFRLLWTSCAAYNSAFSGVATKAYGLAGELYAQRRDTEAAALRNFAQKIERLANEKSQELQGFIEEDARRTREYQSKGHVRPELKATHG